MRSHPYSALLILLFTLLTIFSYGQNAGFVKLKITGTRKPICRIDTIGLRTNDTCFSIYPGNHTIKIWAPHLLLIDTTFSSASDTSKLNFEMKRDPRYVQYLKDYSFYKEDRNKRLYLSPILMGLCMGSGILVNRFVAEKQYKKAMYSRERYLRMSNQNLLDEQKAEFDFYKKKYNTWKKVEWGTYSIAGALAINYVRLVMKQRKIVAPKYSEEKLLSRVNMSIFPDISNKTVLYGLTYKL